MNVNDRWMLEQMQQMAANMAASLPQAGQNTDTPEAGKGESFKDMLDKAKDQKVEASEKDGAPEKNQTVQKAEQPQKVEQKQAAPKNTSRVNLDSNTAALVAAGYAQVLEVFEDGSALILLDAEMTSGGFSVVSSGFLTDGQELVPVTITNALGEKMTITPEQLQEVFDRLGVEGPQKSEQGMTLVGKLNFSEHQDMVIRTTDGQTTTLKEWTEQTDDQEDSSLDASVMTAGQPLFKDVKAAPVKVGESFELDTQQPEMDDQLAESIRYAAQQGLRQIEIRLSPENLGNLTIKLTQAVDGTLQVVLHAATPRAAAILNQHLDNLNTALQGYGQTETRVEVQRSEDSQQAQQQQTDPNGHNRQQQQQQRQEQHAGSQDFIQRLRLGLFELEDVI